MALAFWRRPPIGVRTLFDGYDFRSTQAMPEIAAPAHITSLVRHFEDLRDGTQGGSSSRDDKEAHFEKAVQLLAPVARQVLIKMNTILLLNTGQITEMGLRSTKNGGARSTLGFELAGTEGSRGRADRAPSLFRTQLPPPSSSRNNSS